MNKLLLILTAVPIVYGLYSSLRPVPVGARFIGFREEVKQNSIQTTTRQRDGREAYDFWFYPLIDVIPDLNGNFEVKWRYRNFVDGSIDYDSGEIVNVFAGLQGGQLHRLELHDTRPTPPRDPNRGESIAYGDPDKLFDGVWHAFRCEVSVSVTSPSGAIVNTSGVLEEVFKTVGALNVAFAGFNEQIIP